MNTAPQITEPTTTSGTASAATIPDEIVELNFDDEIDEVLGRPLSNAESWARFASVNEADMDARSLLTRFHRMWSDVHMCLSNADGYDNPSDISRQYRAALRIVKAMLTVLRSLDLHRHGRVQDIIVERVGEAESSVEPTPENPELARSDRLVDELVQGTLSRLDGLALRCREEAKWLSDMPSGELRRIKNGHRIGPDRRRWETKFLDMAGHLAGQVVRLTDDLERRHKPIRQHIRVRYVGERPNRKLCKAAVTEKSASSQHAEVN